MYCGGSCTRGMASDAGEPELLSRANQRRMCVVGRRNPSYGRDARRIKMVANDEAHAKSANRELWITRIFDAPRTLVFKAWTDPACLAHWMGPQGFTSTIVTMDARPGGAYRFHMRSPSGDDHWSQGVYREIVEPERIVFTSAWADLAGTRINTLRPMVVTARSEEHTSELQSLAYL